MPLTGSAIPPDPGFELAQPQGQLEFCTDATRMAAAGIPLEDVVAAHRAGRMDEAEAGYLGWLSTRPDDADALHFLGLLRMQQRRVPEAIELVRRSVELLPTNPHAWNNLGNLLVAAGQEAEALSAYERAASIAPHMEQAVHNLGVILRKRGRPEDAIAAFARVIAANPSFAPGWQSLASVLYRTGRREEAAIVYRKWLEADPDNPIPRHMVAATSGSEVPERAGKDYLATTYDDFADTFDDRLNLLEYAAPQMLAAVLGEHINVGRGDLAVLDAGCGTGLCGLLLRSTARSLSGVDLSQRMLGKAREREIYDELVQDELCAFMRSRPDTFDVIVSSDTLIYFGVLDEPIQAARAALRPGGVFAFTVEAAPAESPHDFALLAHGRYAHRRDYIVSRLENAGFERPHIESAVLRKELDEDVEGFLVVAHAPADRTPDSTA